MGHAWPHTVRVTESDCVLVCCGDARQVRSCHALSQFRFVSFSSGRPHLVQRALCMSCMFHHFQNRHPCSCKYQRRLEISVLFLECDLGGLTGLPNLVLLKWGYHSLPSRIFKGTSWDYHMRSPGRRYFQFFHSLGPWVCDRARHGWRFASA